MATDPDQSVSCLLRKHKDKKKTTTKTTEKQNSTKDKSEIYKYGKIFVDRRCAPQRVSNKFFVICKNRHDL